MTSKRICHYNSSFRVNGVGYIVQAMPGCPQGYLDEINEQIFKSKIWPSITGAAGKKVFI